MSVGVSRCLNVFGDDEDLFGWITIGRGLNYVVQVSVHLREGVCR